MARLDAQVARTYNSQHQNIFLGDTNKSNNDGGAGGTSDWKHIISHFYTLTGQFIRIFI